MINTLNLREDLQAAFDIEEAQKWFFHQSLNGVVDNQGYFVALSDKWGDLLGFSVGALLDAPFIEFVHPEDKKKTMLAYKKGFNGVFVNRYLKSDGSYVRLKWANPGMTIGDYSTFKAELDE